eukprot:PLAT13432.1.p1 GENE.PLAT13432.1~~PLAT13432.1.p1  ORF type:complete len:142 (-),score=23.41 PLAT13432.1:69-494(-)
MRAAAFILLLALAASCAADAGGGGQQCNGWTRHRCACESGCAWCAKMDSRLFGRCMLAEDATTQCTGITESVMTVSALQCWVGDAVLWGVLILFVALICYFMYLWREWTVDGCLRAASRAGRIMCCRRKHMTAAQKRDLWR